MLSAVPHMSSAEFRRLGHQAIDWIADYLDRVESFPVASPVKPGDIAAMLPAHPPRHAEDWSEIWPDLDRVVLPGLTHWQSPNFFAFFPANGSYPAILGDLISTGLGVNGMLWATSPACTEIETRVLDWLADMLGLPASFRSSLPSESAHTDGTGASVGEGVGGGDGGSGEGGGGGGGGVIQGTASEAALVAMLAGRERVRARAGGVLSGPPVVYASTQAHSSITKGAMISGIAGGPGDTSGVRLIPTGESFALRPDLLEAALRADLRAGRAPVMVCATVGTTSSTAVDSISRIHEAMQRSGASAAGAWLHVDAAYAGAACICPEFRWMIDGVAHADSFCFNPHKWLLTSFDCDCMWTRDRRSLTGALSITPEYLRNAASSAGAVIDYRDWQIPLGRRFRALKLWFVIRHYGVEGLQAHIREHVRIAARLEELVRQDNRFEIAAPRPLALVCFRLRPQPGETARQTDDRNRALLDRVNASGKAMLTHTVLPAADPSGPSSRLVLRLCVGSTTTQEHHLLAAWALIRSLAE